VTVKLVVSGFVAVLLLAGVSPSVVMGTPIPDAPAQSTAIPLPTPEKVDPTAWQSVIDGQIQAFRKGDAKSALSYASATFRANFSDPSAFMVAIAGSGYAPIFTSVSDSFGKFQQPDSKSVVQEVDFVGPKQELFIAIYQLGLEADGWRVEGVQLSQSQSIGV
jgi:hypothetical protein